MTDFPARGQQAPAYWDTQLKAYIDERDEANMLPERLSESSLSATLVSVQTVDLSGGNVTLAAVTARRMDLIGATAARTLTLPNATASTTVTNSTNYTVTLIRSGATVGVPLAAGDTIDLRA